MRWFSTVRVALFLYANQTKQTVGANKRRQLLFMSNTAKNQNKKKNPNIVCFKCGQVGHPQKLCRVVDTKAAKVASAVMARQQKLEAKIDQVMKSIPRGPTPPNLGKKLKVGANVSTNNVAAHMMKRVGRDLRMWGAPQRHKGGFDHGFARHVGYAHTKHGHAHVFEATERIGTVVCHTGTAAGQLLDYILMNPTNMGPYTRLMMASVSKFVIVEAELIVNMYKTIMSESTEGDIYFALNSNPDDEVPQGEQGLSVISTWKGTNGQPMFFPADLPEPGVKRFTFPLDATGESQSPLFVNVDEDNKWECQGRLVVVAGAPLAPDAPIVPCEYFLRCKYHCYGVNTTPGDLGPGALVGYGTGIPAGTQVLTGLTQWYGTDGLITLHDPATTGVSFALNETGTYIIDAACMMIPGSPITPASDVDLVWYAQQGMEDVVPITGGFLNSTVTTNDIGTNYGVVTTHTSGAISLSLTKYHDEVGALQAWPTNSAPYVNTRFAFCCQAGQPFLLTWPVASGLSFDIRFTIMQIDNIYHPEGEYESRSTPTTVSSLASQRREFLMLAALDDTPRITDRDFGILCETMRSRLADASNTPADTVALTEIVRRCELPVATPSTTGMIIPAVAAIISAAIAAVGPKLAEAGIDWIVRKIEGKDKEKRLPDIEYEQARKTKRSHRTRATKHYNPDD